MRPRGHELPHAGVDRDLGIPEIKASTKFRNFTIFGEGVYKHHCLLTPTVVVTLACLKAVIGALNKEKVLMSVSSEYWVT